MSTSSPKPFTKRLLCSLASISAVAVLLLHALPLVAHPANAAALLLRPAAMLLPGAHDFWHTEGNLIRDTHNKTVRISGMNWSGFETKQAVPGGLESRDYRAILRTIKENGYNTVRIPFSNEMIETPMVPDRISFSGGDGAINTDLRGLNSLEILDRIIAQAGRIGLKVILDNHRSEAGSSAQESGLWYTPQFPESSWIEDWRALALRYQDTSTVIGMDLRNEPHNAEKGGACWDCGGAHDWHSAAQRAGNAILAVNPRLLIFVEGVDTYAGDTYWWGGNLEGVRHSPVHLSIPNRLVYSAHEYGPTEYAQPWFNPSTSPATLASIWRRHWEFISETSIAPVWIGEFGAPNDDADVRSLSPGTEGQWFNCLIEFLGTHPALGWTYWGVNGEDRYGLLDLAYSSKPVSQRKAEALTSISTISYARNITHTASESLPVQGELSPEGTTSEPLTSFATPQTKASAETSYSPSPQVVLADLSGSPRATRSRTVASAHLLKKSPGSVETIPSSIAASVQRAVSIANQNLSE